MKSFMKRIKSRLSNDNQRVPKTVELTDRHTLDEGKFKLKFYDQGNGRYNVQYRGNYLCFCDKKEIAAVQSDFDKDFNGNNLTEMNEVLRKKYNKVTRTNNVPKTQKRTRRKNRVSYKTGRLTFENRKNGRLQVRVLDKGKTQSICCCYPEERDEVVERYNNLKKDHTLQDIKKIMKKDYNIRKSRDKNYHNISINSNGVVYLDGKFVKSDANLYDLVNKRL